MREELSPAAKQLLDSYFALRVGQFRVTCPYFMNVRKSRMSPIVYSGKGLPEEIEREARRILKSRGNAVSSESARIKTAQDAKDFLVLCGLGVDCSGLVVNVLKAHFQDSVGKSIYKFINVSNILKKAMSLLRPRTSISSDLLTGDLNSSEIILAEVRSGDMLRQGWQHLLLIEWAERKKGKLIKLGYVESNTRPEWGVQRGEIHITDIHKPLGKQKWSVEMARQRFIHTPDSRIVRLHV